MIAVTPVWNESHGLVLVENQQLVSISFPGAASGAAGGQIFLSDLQRYFTELGNAPPGLTPPPGLGGAESAQVERELPTALAAPDVVATATAPTNAERLASHLPEAPSTDTQDEVRITLLSPQFAQVNLQVLRTPLTLTRFDQTTLAHFSPILNFIF